MLRLSWRLFLAREECQESSRRNAGPTARSIWRAGALLARVAVDSRAGQIPFKQVELQGGLVSLVPIEQLQARIHELGTSAAQAQSQAGDLAQQVHAKMAEAGAVMADHWQEWPAQELFARYVQSRATVIPYRVRSVSRVLSE